MSIRPQNSNFPGPYPFRLVKHSKQNGMTLIELAITLVVVAILVMLCMPSFATWMHNSFVRTTSESIRSGLQLARTEAVRRNTRIAFALNGTTWTVAGGGITEQSNGGEPAGRAQVVASQDLLMFDGVGWVTPLPAKEIVIDVTSPLGGTCADAGGPIRCMRILVSGGGQIRMCDPAAPSTTAAACRQQGNGT